MPDPIRDLASFRTDGVPVSPLPASEVRRRGDRLRRRNHAAAAMVGVAAVVAVAVPVSVFAGGAGERGQEPPPVGPSGDEWYSAIPEDFELSAGMVAPDGEAKPFEPAGESWGDLRFCDDIVWPARPAGQVDHRTLFLEPESGSQTRELVLFEDQAAARTAFARAAAALPGCLTETDPGSREAGDESEILREPHQTSLGEESLAFTEHWTGHQPGQFTIGLARVGNAVLAAMVMDAEGGEAGPRQLALLERTVSPAVDRMCIFAAEPCRTTPSDDEPPLERDPGDVSWRSDIPEGFPLLVGIDNDPEGSTPSVSPEGPGLGSVGLCDREVWPAESVDRLTGEDPALDHHWNRELLLLPSDAEARSALAGIRDRLAACGSEQASDPAVPDLEAELVHTSYDVDTGAEETVTWTDAYAGGAIHARVFQFVRVGNALAASVVDSEGNASSVGGQVPMVTEQTRPLVEEMCVFAEHPCTIGTEPAEPAQLGDGNLVRAGDLPRVEGMPWRAVAPQPVPTLACQGDWLTELGPQEIVSREFRITAASADAELAMLNTAVLRFARTDLADEAYDTVLGWLEDCPASRMEARPTRVDRLAPVDVAGADRAHGVLVTWQPPDFCPEGCDMAWFDHQTVVQAGDRLVLVSEAEAGGPCAPGDACPETEDSMRPWKDRVAEITRLVVAAGTRDPR